MLTAFVKTDDGYTPLEHISEVELTADEDCNYPWFGTDEFSATLDCDMSELWQRLLPRGMVNARILKRDGFLSPENGVMDDDG